MDATLEVLEGVVRVFNLNPVPSQGDDNTGRLRPPYMDAGVGGTMALTGDWAVGQVPLEPNGRFKLTAGGAGSIRVFDEYLDPSTGSVASSNDSTTVNMAAGETQEFKTTNSNAYKVSTGA